MQTLDRLLQAGRNHTPDGMAQQRLAMRLSLGVGVLMLAGKSYAYAITGSAAILSDAAESVVHVFAVAFATWSLWVSTRPADDSHPYGHDKVAFFSAGVEGALIVVAAFYIIYTAIGKWVGGLELQNLSTGTWYVAAASVINVALGGYLVWLGRRTGSIILVANGHHVLTDAWTSFGVVAGLLLTIATGWLPFDPLIAIAVALNILWAGGRLVRQAVGGLMDEGDPQVEALVRRVLDEETAARGLAYHALRYRAGSATLFVELHLLFPGGLSLADAHHVASEVEAALHRAVPGRLSVITHLEPREGHDAAHGRAGLPSYAVKR
jgi:cation diffusion facilitator family transporter